MSRQFVVSVGLAIAYLAGVQMLTQSRVSAEATLSIEAPFVYRMLIPYVLGQFFPTDVLDSFILRAFVAAGSVFLILQWMPIFTSRVLTQSGETYVSGDLVQWVCTAVLMTHYVLPHRFHFYYIYDLPAIAMYLALFILITDKNKTKWWHLAIATTIFSLNRETIVIAVLHAYALNWHETTPSTSNKLTLTLKVCMMVAIIIATRLALMSIIHAPHGQVAEYMDGENLRILANWNRVTTQFQHTVAILYFGCAALIWLPLSWSALPAAVKSLFRVSLVPVGALLVVGNPTELRIFNELVPLLSVGLACALKRPGFREGQEA